MNILILSHFAGSPEHGMVFRNYAMAREWVRQGHDVTIVASGYSHVRQRQPEFKGRVGSQLIDGVRYLWLWGPRYPQGGQLGRVASMAAYTLQCLLLPLPLQAHYDVVIGSSPHPFTVYPAARLARRYGARLVFDIRDLWPLTPIHLGNASPRHPFIRLLQAAEDYGCRHADLVTAVPHNAEAYLQSRGLAPGRFLAIGNGALHDDTPSAPLPETHAALLHQLRERAAFILGYAGTLGTANSMEVAVDALARANPRVHLVMMGDGACRAALQQQAERLGCRHRVHFLAPVARRQVASFLAQVDAAYVGLHASPLYAYGASLTKLNDYMLASVPILYSVGDNNNPVEAARAGVCCPPGDPAAIGAAIDRLQAMPASSLRAMGAAGRQWCLAHHMVASQVRLILETLQQLPARA
ncbi:MAG TPA: glycosyltransferase family 4 protein [Bordetella sp.]|nr:glycosyltransferase family 4 protein [Bordetella sp.]